MEIIQSIRHTRIEGQSAPVNVGDVGQQRQEATAGGGGNGPEL